ISSRFARGSTHIARHACSRLRYARSGGRRAEAPGDVAVIDTLRLTVEEAAVLLERRQVSAGELTAAYLAAVDEREEELHAFLHVNRNGHRDAPSAGQNGHTPKVGGVPIALKDVITTKGMPTTAGSRIP